MSEASPNIYDANVALLSLLSRPRGVLLREVYHSDGDTSANDSPVDQSQTRVPLLSALYPGLHDNLPDAYPLIGCADPYEGYSDAGIATDTWKHLKTVCPKWRISSRKYPIIFHPYQLQWLIVGTASSRR